MIFGIPPFYNSLYEILLRGESLRSKLETGAIDTSQCLECGCHLPARDAYYDMHCEECRPAPEYPAHYVQPEIQITACRRLTADEMHATLTPAQAERLGKAMQEAADQLLKELYGNG